jgi:hypothetical protein
MITIRIIKAPIVEISTAKKGNRDSPGAGHPRLALLLRFVPLHSPVTKSLLRDGNLYPALRIA